VSDLFGDTPTNTPQGISANSPLADRIRPQSLAEVVGQEHLTGPMAQSGAWWRPGGFRR